MPFQKGHKGFYKGGKMSEEHKRKIGIANKGKKLPNFSGDKACNWKGTEATKEAKHLRISKKYGKPQYCEFCMTTEKRRYHWASISHDYHPDFCDWLRLCVSCHKKFDLSKIN